MQFLGVVGLAIVAVFVGAFLVSTLSASFASFSESFPVNRGYPYTTEDRGRVSGNAAQVAGAYVAGPFEDAESITSILRSLPNVSRFEALFSEAEGSAYMNAGQLYTLFVPTDAAFQSLSYDEQVLLNTMTDLERTRLVTYHLVPQKMVAVGGQKAGTVTAISRDTLNFALFENGGTVGNANVVSVHQASNGIVYVIDTPLLPPLIREEPSLRDFSY